MPTVTRKRRTLQQGALQSSLRSSVHAQPVWLPRLPPAEAGVGLALVQLERTVVAEVTVAGADEAAAAANLEPMRRKASRQIRSLRISHSLHFHKCTINTSYEYNG